MWTTVAFAQNDNTALLFDIDMTKQEVSHRRIDTAAIIDEKVNLLLYSEETESQDVMHLMKKELKFYPIFPVQSFNLDLTSIKNLDYKQLVELYDKASSRWVLANNLKTVEEIYPTVEYMKTLWIKDRNSFFEELWFFVKSNLATHSLNIIFHDLKEPSTKQQEKGEKPKLCYSYVKGDKIPHLFEGKTPEELLMKEYEAEFNQSFQITEYQQEKSQLIACAKIELSPILIMAEIKSINHLQQSILQALFTGLQGK